MPDKPPTGWSYLSSLGSPRRSRLSELGAEQPKEAHPNTATLENMRQSFKADPQSERSSERAMFEVHADDKAIITAIGGSAFCAGLFGFYEGYPVLGTAFIIGGLVTMAPISPFVRSRIGWAFGRPTLWTLAVSTWLFLAANLGFSIYDHFLPKITEIAPAAQMAPVQQNGFTIPPPPPPLTKEARELRSQEYVELYNSLGKTSTKAVDLGEKLAAQYAPTDRAARLQQVVRYKDAIDATFSELQSIVQKYPFSDLAAEFTNAREIGEVKQAVLSPIPDCLDLLSAMPDPPPLPLLNYLRNKLAMLRGTSEILRDWVQGERRSLAVRIQSGQ
jgi:hypothetical protein